MAAIELRHTSLFDDANLVSYWQFEGNSNDSKGSNNGTDTSVSYATGNGKFNQGAAFNGSSSVINIGSNASLHPSVYTMLAWINPSGNTIRPILSLAGENSPAFRVNADNTITLTHVDAVNIGSSLGTVTNGSWNLVVVTYSAGAWKIYINGSLDNSGSNSQTQSFSNAGLIGKDGSIASNYFNGSIDEVALFSRVLTTQEVNDLYNGNLAGASSISPSASRSPSASLSPSSSISASISPSSSSSRSLSPSASLSPSSSVSPSLSPSASLSPSTSLSPSISPSSSISSSVSPSASISPSSSASASSSPSASISPSVSPSPSTGYAMYSRGHSTILPTNQSDLATPYTDQEELIVRSSDGIFVTQKGMFEYMLHEFKVFAGDQTICTIMWEGRSTLAPSISPIYLQIFNQLTQVWETIDSDSVWSEDQNLILEADVLDLTNYKTAQNTLSCRVYQLAI